MAAQTTTGLSNEVKTYLSSVFLARAKHLLVHKEGAQKNTHAKGEGKTITWDRYTPLSAATTALTEGVNPSEVNISSATVTVTLAEYGTTIKVSKLLSLTSIDKNSKEKAELLGQNMGETLDQITRDALYSGATARLAGAKTAVSDIASSDVFNYTEIKKAVRQLENAKALRYSDGYFIGKVGPYTKYDLISDSAWLNAKTYSDVKDLYESEMGELGGVRFLLTTNQKVDDLTVDIYSNFIHGQQAFGCYDLEGDMPKLYIKVPGENDTSNPADRYSVMSWAGTYAAKVLIADWILNVKTAASA